MKARVWNIPLLFGFLISIVTLFWPFAYWDSTASLVLRIVASVCLQLLFCRNARYGFGQFLPALVCTMVALWGLYLFYNSPDWTCTFREYAADYASPALSCAAACWLYQIL